jgi:hypothetical protein
MNVLIGCEFSGVVREAFRRRGHVAYSCDVLPAEDHSRYHLQGDIEYVLAIPPGGVYLNTDPLPAWDLFIAHPPCTYLANSGVRWLYQKGTRQRIPKRWTLMRRGAQLFQAVLNADIPRVAVENPIMHKYAKEIIGVRQSQTIQPWQFGHREIKATCLWLRELPPLVDTDNVGPPPKDVIARRQWARVHRASPGPDRWKERSRTLLGIAEAMADQWGSL